MFLMFNLNNKFMWAYIKHGAFMHLRYYFIYENENTNFVFLKFVYN